MENGKKLIMVMALVTFCGSMGNMFAAAEQDKKAGVGVAGQEDQLPTEPLTEEQRVVLNQRLLRAAESGNVDAVSVTLRDGADVNVVGFRQQTSLMSAVFLGRSEIVQLLLKNKANPNEQTRGFGQSLCSAVCSGHIDIVKMLLEHNARLDVLDECYRSPLYCAAEKGHVEMVKMLLQKGAAVDVVDRFGDTLLCSLMNATRVFSVDEDKRAEIVQLLLDNNATIEAISGLLKQRPLGMAICKGYVKSVTVLILAGAHIIRASKNLVASSVSMTETIKEAQRIRDDLGQRDWSTERLLKSGILVDLGMPVVLERVIASLCESYVEDAFINTCIDREIARRERGAIKRAELVAGAADVQAVENNRL